MKKYAYCHHTGLLVLRLVLVTVFLFHVLAKFGAGEQMITFIGGAPLSLGLTFFPAVIWFYLAIVGELFIIITMAFGIWTRLGSVVLLIMMFFAMVAKQWSFPDIELDIILASLGIVMFIAGPGKFSLSKHHREGHRAEDNIHHNY